VSLIKGATWELLTGDDGVGFRGGYCFILISNFYLQNSAMTDVNSTFA
jgi:hypothetical protein